jgi:uncharacterized membrane protein (UPF0127 family)
MATTLPSDASLLRTVEKPTPEQAAAGNYRKAHVTVQGFDITIENPRGSVRSGVTKNGQKWSNTMAHHYGYFKRTEGKDEDQVDVFVGPDPAAFMVFVVDQVTPSGTFDEHKVMLGFKNKEAARQGYLANYAKGWRVGEITAVTVPQFKKWLKGGNTTKPFATWRIAEALKTAAATLSKSASMVKTIPFKVVNGDQVKGVLEAEFADDNAARTKGMAKHSSVPLTGMLFDIPGPFWMKGMTFPLDVAFLDKKGEVLEIQHMPVSMAPDFFKARYSPRHPAATCALEMPAGWFGKHAVAPGDKIEVAAESTIQGVV